MITPSRKVMKIKNGDKVVVDFGNNETIEGIVRHMAQATGDNWIIENDYGVFYIQRFDTIFKKKPE